MARKINKESPRWQKFSGEAFAKTKEVPIAAISDIAECTCMDPFAKTVIGDALDSAINIADKSLQKAPFSGGGLASQLGARSARRFLSVVAGVRRKLEELPDCDKGVTKLAEDVTGARIKLPLTEDSELSMEKYIKEKHPDKETEKSEEGRFKGKGCIKVLFLNGEVKEYPSAAEFGRAQNPPIYFKKDIGEEMARAGFMLIKERASEKDCDEWSQMIAREPIVDPAAITGRAEAMESLGGLASSMKEGTDQPTRTALTTFVQDAKFLAQQEKTQLPGSDIDVGKTIKAPFFDENNQAFNAEIKVVKGSSAKTLKDGTMVVGIKNSLVQEMLKRPLDEEFTIKYPDNTSITYGPRTVE